jgi:hypothetical protein
LKEVPATVKARQGKGSARLAAWWWSVVPAVLRVNPVD